MDNITKGDFGEGGRRLAARKKKKRTFLILLCIIAIAIALFLSPIFSIGTIKVTGTKELTAEYVITNAGLKSGTHITKVNFKETEDILTKTPYISSAKVKYKFPNSLEVIVEEKMPVVYYKFADGYVGINVDGVVADIIQTMEKKLPIASGITLHAYAIGQKPELSDSQSVHIDVLTDVAGTIYDLGMSETIVSIDVSEITNIILCTDNDITVKCGDTSELDYKLSMLKVVLEHTDPGGVADISTPGQAIHNID